MWYVQAKLLKAMVRFPEAIAACDEVVRLQPDNPEWYYQRGRTLSYAGDHVRAIADYRHALALKPDHPDVLAGIPLRGQA